METGLLVSESSNHGFAEPGVLLVLRLLLLLSTAKKICSISGVIVGGRGEVGHHCVRF